MTALEILMLIIGIICFVFSFILTNDDSEPVSRKKGSYKPEITKEQEEFIEEQVDSIVTNKLAELEESTEAALDKISNTKILEMNEYVESVLAGIDKNHNETVFMYDMLNDKSKEIKEVLKDIQSVRTEIIASGTQTEEQTKHLEQLIKESEKAVKEMDVAIRAAYKTKAAIEAAAEETVQQIPDNVITPQVFEQKSSMSNNSNNKQYEPEQPYMAKVEPETILASNCNEEILAMHAEGKSNLEIAKKLNLGMGEVKLVIDLFNNSRR